MDNPIRTIVAAPQASMLMESVRDIGYSLAMALADVIDNSITARAATIQLFTRVNNNKPQIGILDDGIGMAEDILHNAMRLGSVNPLDKRARSDLGRFGLGLKTASFSQCRRLTVVTRQNNKTSIAVWDLDLVARENEWLVEIPPNPDAVPWSELLGNHGTLVVWEKIDRLAGKENQEIDTAQFNRDFDKAIGHLELVFHRFLAGETGIGRIDIRLNNRPLNAFNPFYPSHPATMAAPEEIISIRGHKVRVQAFTLPHHSKVDKKAWKRYAGPEGYLKNQGFYVYRAKRLIIHGTWFGLIRQQELTKLSRVRVDMPNGLDAEWKIDIKKSWAQLPPVVGNRLRRVIDRVVAGSKRTYTGRGSRLAANDPLPVWCREQNKTEISYRLNPDHLVFIDFNSHLSEELQSAFAHLLKLCESALPLQAIYADMGNQPQDTNVPVMADETLLHTIRTIMERSTKNGLETEKIIEILRVAEPYRSHWPQTEACLRQIITEEKVSVQESG